MKSYEVRNYRMIKVCYVPPTNTRGTMIKIFETKRYNDQKTQSKKFSYDYQIGDVAEQAFDILVRNGFNVIGRASQLDYYVFFCDNWSNEFIEVKDLK